MSDRAAGGAAPRVPRRRTRLRRVLLPVAVALVAVFALRGLPQPLRPALAPASSAEADRLEPAPLALPGCTGGRRPSTPPLEGFGQVAFRVAAADGSTTFDGCAHLAATPEARGQGLMHQLGLGGHDAMVFRFDEPGSGSFYMFQTALPLSIAFLGADGAVVSTADMDPCREAEPSACPTFSATGPYLHAIEVPRGDLGGMGIVAGARVAFEEVVG